ncbi:MAG: hypothetical protein QM755_10280 [Luteolibacter sp.]
MIDQTLYLIGGADDEIANFIAFPLDDHCHVQFTYRGKQITATASDYFEALSDIRLQLEAENLIPFCYGASLNVFPSGMCRDMGAGLSAYRLTLGQTPRQSDLVGIFDSGPDVIPASVANQKAFFETWLQTPKVRPVP